jgi:CarboxypepD_reg-like domain
MIKNVFKTLISIVFLLLFIGFTLPVFAQKTLVVSGYIEDAASGERLISAAIVDETTRNGTVTNTYGFFSLSITEGSKNLLISYIGYAPQRISVNGDTTLTVKLVASNVLQSLEVNAKKQDRIENTVQMSRNSIPIEQIKRMPMLLGEADVLKSLQLLPGVKGGTEGTAGI